MARMKTQLGRGQGPARGGTPGGPTADADSPFRGSRRRGTGRAPDTHRRSWRGPGTRRSGVTEAALSARLGPTRALCPLLSHWTKPQQPIPQPQLHTGTHTRAGTHVPTGSTAEVGQAGGPMWGPTCRNACGDPVSTAQHTGRVQSEAPWGALEPEAWAAVEPRMRRGCWDQGPDTHMAQSGAGTGKRQDPRSPERGGCTVTRHLDAAPPGGKWPGHDLKGPLLPSTGGLEGETSPPNATG